MKQWYAEAKGWYEKAKAAHPDDLSIARRLTEFFRRTKQDGRGRGTVKRDSKARF